jgi:hypothetical protein
MEWLTGIEVALAIAALAVSIAALVPTAYQAYLDRVAVWPYKVVFLGRPKDPIGPWMIHLAFRVANPTSSEAFFEIRMIGAGTNVREVPHYISVWPSQERPGLYVVVPPKASREIRVSPFGPQDQRKIPEWTLSIIEYSHRHRPIDLRWPDDLDRMIDVIATDIPVPPSR